MISSTNFSSRLQSCEEGFQISKIQNSAITARCAQRQQIKLDNFKVSLELELLTRFGDTEKQFSDMLEDNVELVEDFKKTICKMLQDVSGDVAEDKKDIEEPKTDFKLGKLDKTVASGNSTEGADRELRLESNLKQLESKVESRLLDMEARLAGVITEVRSDNVAVVDELNKKLSTSMNDWDGGRTRLEGSLSPIMGLVEGWSSRIQELELEVPKVGKKSVELRQDIQRTKEYVLSLPSSFFPHKYLPMVAK